MTQSAHEKVNAYKSNQQVRMDGREIDMRALLNCANRLKIALDNDGKDIKLYQDALRHNQHLWTIFQVALTDPSNELTTDLKLTLLRLSGFVDQVTFKNICAFSSQALNTLIDLNRSIAAGLAKKVEQKSGEGSQNLAPPMLIAGTPAAVMTSA